MLPTLDHISEAVHHHMPFGFPIERMLFAQVEIKETRREKRIEVKVEDDGRLMKRHRIIEPLGIKPDVPMLVGQPPQVFPQHFDVIRLKISHNNSP